MVEIILKVIFLTCIVAQCYLVSCEFVFPELKLEAFEPEGFRVSIPEIDNVKLFAFHGARNRPLSQIDPGEFSMDIINPKSKGWSYTNPDLKLHVGDKVYYWAFIQHGNLGYKKEGQVWEVKELAPAETLNNSDCDNSLTEVLGKLRICKKELIFDSTFSDINLDEFKWKRAHYIPAGPDYEFCSYQRRNDTTYIKDSKLIVKAIPLTKEEDTRGTLDLRNGCTSHAEEQCIAYQDGGFILPPTVVGKIKTNNNFKYGTVEVRAKLPAGDWIYPKIFLESSTLRLKRIWIAYSRGNEQLIGNGGNNLGGNLLFGGPILNVSEPDRSKYLSSYRQEKTFSSEYHTYSVVWTPTKISLLLDGIVYGETENSIPSLFNEPMHVVLGLGVGGVTDFPDYYVSGKNIRKPWDNYERLQMKKFFQARDDWLPTWKDDRSSLIVEYVKIWAL